MIEGNVRNNKNHEKQKKLKIDYENQPPPPEERTELLQQ